MLPFTTMLSSSIRKILVALAVLSVLTALVLLFSTRFLFSPIEGLERPAVHEVEAGSSLSRVANQLQTRGFLDYPILLRILARVQGVANQIKVGEYQLEPGLTPAQLLRRLVQGDTIQYRVTLVEGWTFAQALTTIWGSEKITVELADASFEQIAQRLQLDTDNPEGMLFPDTYFYTKGTSDIELLQRANSRLVEVLNSAWEQRLGALPYTSPYQALIMASIIEKESSVGSERGHIAGVFVRRLEQGMRLQSDPTVIYGLGQSFDGDLRGADLRNETPYNTYRINGLPPSPIALAGRESILASLNPLSSDYLYFVARGDGSHYFSSTLEEHNAAVTRFQRQAQ